MKDLETREDIELLVNSFYVGVQENEVLSAIFNDIAKVDWEHHLPKMFDFWETLLFHKAVYKGNPMKVHMILHQLQKLKKEDFEIWLKLFINDVPDSVLSRVLSLSSLSCCTCGTSSEPYVAVAIKQPPPLDD